MANNRIQIKRTSVSGRAANTTTLTNAGELALNMTDGIMYSTNGSVVFEIGANTTNSRVTGNLTVKGIIANGSLGTGGQVLKSNGSATYWVTDSTEVGAAGQVLYRNSSNVLTTSSGLQYDGVSLKVNGNLESVYQNGSEGGEIFLNKPASGTTLSGTGVTIDVFENKIRFFENGGSVRGAYIDLTAATGGVGTNLLSGGGSGSVNTSAQYTWTNTQIFQANVAFTGNNITVVSNTGSVMFAGAGDTNWRIGRSTGSFTKSFYTNNTLDFIAANSNLEGIAFGFTGSSVYLETGYAGTFTINPIYIGNSTVNVSINSTSFSGTSNNALTANNSTNLGGTAAASYVQNTDTRTLSGNLIFSGANVVFSGRARFSGGVVANNSLGTAGQILASNGTSVYWTSDQGANAVTANSLSANFISVSTGTITVGNSTVNTDIGNNYVSVGNSTSYANMYSTFIRIGNSSVTSTINSTSFTGTANNSNNLGGVAAASYVQNTDSRTLSGNLYFTGANVVYDTGLKVSTINATSNGIVANSTSIVIGNSSVNATINSTAFTGSANNATNAFGKAESALNVNSALTANNSTNLGGTAAANFVQNTDSRTLSGNLNFTGANLTVAANLTIASTGELIITSGAGIYANGSLGTANQVLTTNGTTVYWANSSGGGGFTNGQSISVNNFVITGAFTANNSNGTSTQVLSSNGTGAYWSSVSVIDVYYSNGTLAFQGSGSVATYGNMSANSQLYTGNGSNTVYTLATSISDPDNILVILDGLVQAPNTDYTVSGTTLTFTSAPTNNTAIEVRYLSATVSAGKAIAMAMIFGG